MTQSTAAYFSEGIFVMGGCISTPSEGEQRAPGIIHVLAARPADRITNSMGLHQSPDNACPTTTTMVRWPRTVLIVNRASDDVARIQRMNDTDIVSNDTRSSSPNQSMERLSVADTIAYHE